MEKQMRWHQMKHILDPKPTIYTWNKNEHLRTEYRIHLDMVSLRKINCPSPSHTKNWTDTRGSCSFVENERKTKQKQLFQLNVLRRRWRKNETIFDERRKFRLFSHLFSYNFNCFRMHPGHPQAVATSLRLIRTKRLFFCANSLVISE